MKMKTRYKFLIIPVCVFFTIFVLVFSTQFTYVFDDGILPIAIHSKTDTYKIQNTPEQLKGIFANCACQERVKANPETNNLCTQPLIDWENSTHYINNNLCKFMTIEKYEHDTNLKNALKKCWVGNSEYLDDDFVLWSNETHYINVDTCLIVEAKNEN